MEMPENTCKGQKDAPPPWTQCSHVGLPAEPLLASTAVLDVLQDFGEHGAFKALLLSRLLEVIIGSGTWRCERTTAAIIMQNREGLPN